MRLLQTNGHLCSVLLILQGNKQKGFVKHQEKWGDGERRTWSCEVIHLGTLRASVIGQRWGNGSEAQLAYISHNIQIGICGNTELINTCIKVQFYYIIHVQNISSFAAIRYHIHTHH